MKNKRLVSLAVALVFILSCGFSVVALASPSLADWIAAFTGDINYDKYTSFTSQEWSLLSVEERRQNFEYVITDLGGTPHITDDFLSSDLSFQRYNDLVGNSLDLNSPLISQARLEFDGYADFNLGWYDGSHDGGHSGGSFGNSGGSGGTFGDGTVAYTLNDEFLDYIQDHPLPSTSGSSFSCGDYFFEYGVSSSSEVKSNGRPYLTAQCYCDIYKNGVLFKTLRGLSSGSYEDVPYVERVYAFISDVGSSLYFDFDSRHILTPISDYLDYNPIFDLSPYISAEDSISSSSTGIPALAIDFNNRYIEVSVDSDGVTYEGNTYNYNNDNTVTINGDTYHLTVDPSTIDENYYNQFLGDTINNYYYYYNTTETPFDDTDILTALKSIFSSLESFRSSCYTQFKQLYDSVRSIPSSITKLGKKLDTIIDQLKKLNKELEHLTEAEEENNKLAWLDLVSKFKNKVGWSALETSMNNISVAFFGTRSYTVSSSGDINVTITSSGGSVSSSMPSLSVTVLGCKYDLYTCLGSLGSGIDTIKSFISLFLWIGFIVSVFRSIPSIIGGVSSVQDHSNNVVIDKITGEVKRGA